MKPVLVVLLAFAVAGCLNDPFAATEVPPAADDSRPPRASPTAPPINTATPAPMLSPQAPTAAPASPPTSATPVTTPTASPVPAPPASSTALALKIGTLFPLSGALNSLGPDMENGAKLAVRQVNTARAGIDITAVHADDRTTDSSQIGRTFQQLAGEGVTAIVGPCCSGVTAAVLDLAKQEQIVVASPSATSPTLTERDNGGYFLRISPSDAVQGKVLGKLMLDDGVGSIGVLYVNNSYGEGLVKTLRSAVGSAKLVRAVSYPENPAGELSAEVAQLCASPRPSAVVFVAYVDDAATALRAMNQVGCLAGLSLYASESVYNDQIAAKAGRDAQGRFLAASMKGVNPATADLSRFNALFSASYGHTPALYSAESYDGVMYIALAALAAKSTDGAAIQAQIPNILNAPGTKYTPEQFAQAAEAVRNGDDIDFDGYAHNFPFDPQKREPTTGLFDVWTVRSDGQLATLTRGMRA